MKSLSLKLDEKTVQFFFIEETGAFPLLEKAIDLLGAPEPMVRVAAQTTILNVYKVQDSRSREYALKEPILERLCESVTDLSYKKVDRIIHFIQDHSHLVWAIDTCNRGQDPTDAANIEIATSMGIVRTSTPPPHKVRRGRTRMSPARLGKAMSSLDSLQEAETESAESNTPVSGTHRKTFFKESSGSGSGSGSSHNSGILKDEVALAVALLDGAEPEPETESKVEQQEQVTSSDDTKNHNDDDDDDGGLDMSFRSVSSKAASPSRTETAELTHLEEEDEEGTSTPTKEANKSPSGKEDQEDAADDSDDGDNSNDESEDDDAEARPSEHNPVQISSCIDLNRKLLKTVEIRLVDSLQAMQDWLYFIQDLLSMQIFHLKYKLVQHLMQHWIQPQLLDILRKPMPQNDDDDDGGVFAANANARNKKNGNAKDFDRSDAEEDHLQRVKISLLIIIQLLKILQDRLLQRAILVSMMHPMNAMARQNELRKRHTVHLA